MPAMPAPFAGAGGPTCIALSGGRVSTFFSEHPAEKTTAQKIKADVRDLKLGRMAYSERKREGVRETTLTPKNARLIGNQSDYQLPPRTSPSSGRTAFSHVG